MRTLKSALSTLVFIGLSTLSFLSCSDQDDESKVLDIRVFQSVSVMCPDSTFLSAHNEASWETLDPSSYIIKYKNNQPVRVSPFNQCLSIVKLSSLEPQATYSLSGVTVGKLYSLHSAYNLLSVLSIKYALQDEGVQRYTYLNGETSTFHSYKFSFVLGGLPYQGTVYVSGYCASVSVDLISLPGDTLPQLTGQAILDTLDELSLVVSPL